MSIEVAQILASAMRDGWLCECRKDNEGKTMTDEEKLAEIGRLLRIALNAGHRMRLDQKADDLSLPSEVREFAIELAAPGAVGGNYSKGLMLIRQLRANNNKAP